MYNKKLRQSVRSKNNKDNDPKSVTKRKRPRKEHICGTSIDDKDATWLQNDVGKLRQSQKDNKRPVVKNKRDRSRIEDIYDKSDAHVVKPRSHIKRNEHGVRTFNTSRRKPNQEAVLYSDESAETNTSDEASDGDPSNCDSLKAKDRNSLAGFKPVSSQRPDYVNTLTQLYNCEDCDAHFLTRVSRSYHTLKNLHHSELIQCKTCKFKFTSHSLKRHIQIHHRRMGLRRKDFKVVRKHESRLRSKISSQLFKCEDCDANFLTRRARHAHVVCNRHGQKLFACEKCNFKFSKITLGKHMLIQHRRLGLRREDFEVIKQHEVKNCDKTSSNNKEASRVKLFKCIDCDAHYLNRGSLRKHVQSKRHNNHLAQCETCKIKFPPVTLTKHIEVHHNRLGLRRQNFKIIRSFMKKYQDSMSNANSDYSGQIDLDKNQSENNNSAITTEQNKTATTRVQLFKCKDCDAHFLSRRTLRSHLLSKRHDMKLVMCEICNIKFNSYTYPWHMDVHHYRLRLPRENFDVIVGLHPPARREYLTRKENSSGVDSESSDVTKSAPNKNSKENVLYKCVDCDLHFLKENTFYKHISKICDIGTHAAGTRRCLVCKLTFDDVNKHKLLHHKKQRLALKDFKIITICNATSNIAKHTEATLLECEQRKNTSGVVRTGEPQLAQKSPVILYRCRGCLNHFISEERATVHQNVCSPHDETNGVPCEVCGRTFCQGELLPHRERDHKTVRAEFRIVEISRAQLFKCEHCDIHFMQRRSLKTHQVEKSISHTNRDLCECNICKILFSAPSLEKHKKVHHHRLGLRPEDIDVFVGLNCVPAPRKDITIVTRSQKKFQHSRRKTQQKQLENKTKKTRTTNKKTRIKYAPIVTSELHQRINKVTCNGDNIEHGSINKLTKDPKDACINSKDANSPSASHIIEASLSEYYKFRNTILNEICVPKLLRCRVVIENTMLENVNKYIKRKTVHSNVTKTSETIGVPLENSNKIIPHNRASDSITVGYEDLFIKTESDDEDIALSWSDDVPENENNYDDSFNVKDEIEGSGDEIGVPDNNHSEIYDVKDEVQNIDESNEDEVDVSGSKGPEIKIYKVEDSDSVLVSVLPNTQETLNAENNDVFVKIKNVFSIASLKTVCDATGVETVDP